MIREWIGCVLIVLALGVPSYATPVDAEARALFRQAQATAESDLTAARRLYEAAALQYQVAASKQPASRGPLYYNAGNAFFLAGDLGRAVGNYRLSERAMPSHALLAANLNYVLEQAGAPSETDQAASRFRGWLVRWMGWGAVILFVCYLSAWVCGGMWLGRGGRRWHRACVACLVMASLAGLVCWGGVVAGRDAARAVVIGDHVTPRKGPGHGYNAAFEQSLSSGAECRVEAVSGQWLRVMLIPQRQVCWLPKAAVWQWARRGS